MGWCQHFPLKKNIIHLIDVAPLGKSSRLSLSEMLLLRHRDV